MKLSGWARLGPTAQFFAIVGVGLAIVLGVVFWDVLLAIMALVAAGCLGLLTSQLLKKREHLRKWSVVALWVVVFLTLVGITFRLAEALQKKSSAPNPPDSAADSSRQIQTETLPFLVRG